MYLCDAILMKMKLLNTELLKILWKLRVFKIDNGVCKS